MMARKKLKSRNDLILEAGMRVRLAKDNWFRYANWPEGVYLYPGLTGKVTEIRQPLKGLAPFAIVAWDNGVETAQEGTDLIALKPPRRTP
jgi:hypothetical protein